MSKCFKDGDIAPGWPSQGRCCCTCQNQRRVYQVTPHHPTSRFVCVMTEEMGNWVLASRKHGMCELWEQHEEAV